jgi:hypothetical protein
MQYYDDSGYDSLPLPTVISIEELNIAFVYHSPQQECSFDMFTPAQRNNKSNYNNNETFDSDKIIS